MRNKSANQKAEDIAKHYLEHKVLGAYETAEVIEEKESKLCFDDEIIHSEKDKTSVSRVMSINGKRFTISSYFLKNGRMTSTEKLLSLIDLDMEKELRKLDKKIDV